MKKNISILILCLSLFQCEEVVDLNLKTTTPRLVIDASLLWVKETDGSVQYIKLSLTSPYYNTIIPPASGASVSVTDDNNVRYKFDEDGDTGVYKNQSFFPRINGVYNLRIRYNDEIYTATETLIPVVPIESVEQKNDAGFSGKDTEIKAFYTDPKNINNFYLFEFINTKSNFLSIDVYDDEFTDGNKIFAFHSDEDLKSGDELFIQSHGISKQYYEFMNILLQQRSDNSGNPFQTQPATIRGNCINQTNPSNYPLGYFRASEVSTFNYIIK